MTEVRWSVKEICIGIFRWKYLPLQLTSILVLGFILCWTPYNVMSLWWEFFEEFTNVWIIKFKVARTERICFWKVFAFKSWARWWIDKSSAEGSDFRLQKLLWVNWKFENQWSYDISGGFLLAPTIASTLSSMASLAKGWSLCIPAQIGQMQLKSEADICQETNSFSFDVVSN